MSGNGSFIARTADTESRREYRTVYHLGEDIKILERKDSSKSVRLPQESHSANRIYAVFYKDGHDVKEIAVYGNDGKRLYTIHTQTHKSLKEHYHLWQGGAPLDGYIYPLTQEMKALLDRIRNL